MKISKIILDNFRQYHGTIEIDLQTQGEQNIVLIGGKNGFGKTNFLISIVWCLYGDKITQIDESFKREVQKETNYQKFIKQSLNWTSKDESNSEFSVEIQFEEIDYPANLKVSDNNIFIRRVFNTDTIEEKVLILNSQREELFHEHEDKVSFINDYLIPLEAAKFVFFDAEKIASWAELSTKDEGNVLNDALGKLLGLDLYENLKEDISVYSNNLKKEGADTNIKEQIINTEKAIVLNKGKIEDIDLKSALNETNIKELKDKIKEYQIFLNKNSRKETTSLNREDLFNELTVLQGKKEELEKRFNELSELAPLAMLGGKIEEVLEQLDLQEQSISDIENNVVIKKKLDSFTEKLFNQPPEPEDGSMSFKNKIFYSDKAQSLLNELFEVKESDNRTDFELDLNNADKELIFKTSQILQQQSKELFESTISEFNTVQLAITAKDKQIKMIDSDLEDETILETVTLKDEADRRLEKIIAENGALENQKDKLFKDNVRLNQQYNILLQKSSGNQLIKNKVAKAKKYIDSLQTFIDNQKRSKKEALANNLLSELQKLMHKMQHKDSSFIVDSRIDILPDGKGLKVSILDSDGNEIPKESFSTGEKQIYISCLIKAILIESIQNFPIFIDTPLGRLDHEHIENILNNYYPNLSSQVVLLATNNEITPRRYKSISDKVSKSYLIVNENKKSNFKPGYFQSYENKN
ncbi:DNA sulfur modification protein DndD [Algoriphagus persicinus]|uniref:DNA sulfur modification protein DndD n=1 Tax=Algoriphagus persicinus TaxID=3108754 RepID=UPI002B3BF60D|nr:DNA sulfur modification protein DndD [Algoriphagus sp. E1-3-M2]MEB2787002.1 DNA sulfur modification protein DndD [Algoriphagus sp. E1-3-M2]